MRSDGSLRGSTRIALFGIAVLMDMVAGTLLFVTPVRAAQLGASYALSGGLGVAWGLGCAVMTFIMGKIVTPRNSAAWATAAVLAQAVVHAGLILFADTPGSMLPFMLAAGLSHTMFYVPYQVFFKTVDTGGGTPLAASVGVYTFAWSAGAAFGPLWSGFLINGTLFGLEGWQLCLVFTIASCLVIAAAIRHVCRRGGHAVHEPLLQDNPQYDFARLSWLAALSGAFAFSLVRGLFPAGAVRMGVPENMQGLVVFAMAFCQALSALGLGRMINWMYRPRLLGVMGVLGVFGMVCFIIAFLGRIPGGWLVPSFLLGSICFGVYSGSFYSYTAFHCLIHPHRAGFNIAVCEGMFAIANVVGLLLGGLMADTYGINSPYVLAGLFIALFTVLQLWCHSRHPFVAQTA